MVKSIRPKVKKDIYLWAIEESQKEFEEINNKFNKIAEWIEGESNPTLVQLKNFANFLKVPFSYMFLNSAPNRNVMEVEFRTIDNKIPNISKNLKDIILDMKTKQDWISDYREKEGWGKISLVDDIDEFSKKDYKFQAKEAKKLINLDEYWYEEENEFEEAYKLLKTLFEEVGIIVMENGKVRLNTKRTLDINEFRAFALYDDYAPVVFINSNDSKAAKLFSCVHEYIHLLFEKEDIFVEKDLNASKSFERRINEITAEFLMPEDHIRKYWDAKKEPFKQIDELSRKLKVSQIALAIRLVNINIVDEKIYIEIKKYTEKIIEQNRKSNGGNFYNTYHYQMSKEFARTVINATESGRLSYPYAFRLLNGISGRVYDEYKNRMMISG